MTRIRYSPAITGYLVNRNDITLRGNKYSITIDTIGMSFIIFKDGIDYIHGEGKTIPQLKLNVKKELTNLGCVFKLESRMTKKAKAILDNNDDSMISSKLDGNL